MTRLGYLCFFTLNTIFSYEFLQLYQILFPIIPFTVLYTPYGLIYSSLSFPSPDTYYLVPSHLQLVINPLCFALLMAMGSDKGVILRVPYEIGTHSFHPGFIGSMSVIDGLSNIY